MTKHRPPPVAIKVAISDAILKHMNEQIENKAPLHEMFPLCANNIIGEAIDKVFDEYGSSELARIETEQQKIIDTLKGVSND
tara:strand:- start:254 stop:499 length:246 start_codon:yes stop_codon:yes gene_type:complete